MQNYWHEINCKKCNIKFTAHKRSKGLCAVCKIKKCKDCGKVITNYYAIYCNRCSYKGNRNHNWSGDNVGYSGVHLWIKRNYNKPELCQICNIVPSYDLCNKSGNYKRNINDWFWACRKCHMLSDGRFKKFITDRILKNRKCELCGSDYKPNISSRRFCGKRCANINNNKKRIYV